MSAPSSASFFAMVRVEDGLELDVSIRILPAESPSTRPPLPRTTSSTTVEFGSESRTASAAEARTLSLQPAWRGCRRAWRQLPRLYRGPAPRTLPGADVYTLAYVAEPDTT